MKLIPMQNCDLTARVSDCDYEQLSQWGWSAVLLTQGYRALRWDKHRMIYMHRQILGLVQGDGILATHCDNDGMNNQRSNLRIRGIGVPAEGASLGLPVPTGIACRVCKAAGHFCQAHHWLGTVPVCHACRSMTNCAVFAGMRKLVSA